MIRPQRWLRERERADLGMSLVGVLATVVILGVLAAGAVLGISSLGGSGDNDSARSRTAIDAAKVRACQATADAARSAATSYFVSSGGTAYPTKWSDLTASQPPAYTLPSGVVINVQNPKQLDSTAGWTLVMVGGGAGTPTFACRE